MSQEQEREMSKEERALLNLASTLQRIMSEEVEAVNVVYDAATNHAGFELVFYPDVEQERIDAVQYALKDLFKNLSQAHE